MFAQTTINKLKLVIDELNKYFDRRFAESNLFTINSEISLATQWKCQAVAIDSTSLVSQIVNNNLIIFIGFRENVSFMR